MKSKSLRSLFVAIAWIFVELWNEAKRRKQTKDVEELRKDPARWWADNFTDGVRNEPEQAESTAPNSDNDAS